MTRTFKTRRYTRSGFERKVIADLDARGEAYLYEPKDSRTAYTVERKYLPDFVLPNGIFVEAKGWFTSADRSKMLRVKAQHPHLEIRFLFQRAKNTLNKNSKTTYAAWAEKHGFKWAEGVIPAEWFSERLPDETDDS